MRAELTIEIARPPEEVFDFLTDVSNLVRWQSGVRGAEIEGGAEARTGARIHETRHVLGRELRTTLEIAEHEPPRLFTLRSIGGPVQLTVRHELEASGAGTRLTVAGEGDPAMLPGFASGLVARRVEKQFRGDFERLKRILES